MLLLMTLQERQVLGIALEGDQLRHGVAQTGQFAKHQLVGPSAGETNPAGSSSAARSIICPLALGALATASNERARLGRDRDVLYRKLRPSRPGLGPTRRIAACCSIQGSAATTRDIDSQLSSLGAGAGLLLQARHRRGCADGGRAPLLADAALHRRRSHGGQADASERAGTEGQAHGPADAVGQASSREWYTCGAKPCRATRFTARGGTLSRLTALRRSERAPAAIPAHHGCRARHPGICSHSVTRFPLNFPRRVRKLRWCAPRQRRRTRRERRPSHQGGTR